MQCGARRTVAWHVYPDQGQHHAADGQNVHGRHQGVAQKRPSAGHVSLHHQVSVVVGCGVIKIYYIQINCCFHCRANFPLLFRKLCAGLVAVVGRRLAAGGPNIAHLKLWEETSAFLNQLLTIIETINIQRNFLLFLKVNNMLYDHVLLGRHLGWIRFTHEEHQHRQQTHQHIGQRQARKESNALNVILQPIQYCVNAPQTVVARCAVLQQFGLFEKEIYPRLVGQALFVAVHWKVPAKRLFHTVLFGGCFSTCLCILLVVLDGAAHAATVEMRLGFAPFALVFLVVVGRGERFRESTRATVAHALDQMPRVVGRRKEAGY